MLEAPLRWHGAPGGVAWRQRPLPYAQTRNCAFRPSVIRRLDAAAIPWFHVIDSDSDRGVEATVSADLGVVALLDGHAPPQLSVIESGSALPDLGAMKINLHAGTISGEPMRSLAGMIRQGFAAL